MSRARAFPFFCLLPAFAIVVVVPLSLAQPPPIEAPERVSRAASTLSRPLPPGAFEADPPPSEVIFPAQRIGLRFDHARHLGKSVGATCKTCHAAAYVSNSVNDDLIPSGIVCDTCHDESHADPNRVVAGKTVAGQCEVCHLGYKPGDANAVADVALPRANLIFSHKAHVDRSIGCPQCHGAVDRLELATRDALPRMRGCFRCHQMPDAASRGEAKSSCDTCHIRGDDGRSIRTTFAGGTLSPPRWLHNAEHTPDFIESHKTVAADDSAFCANCHKEDFCTDCHDGRVRPRSVHPSDYLNMHPIEARMATQRCTSCHHEQSFCLDCHLRAGVAEASPTDARESGRFHPPKSVWSDPPRSPRHHSFEAERNISACVSCHTERDCVVCHGGLGVGGGFDPHKSGFLGGCATQFRRNPRPCLVCHEATDGVLAQCR